MKSTFPSELLELRQFLPDLVAEARRHVPCAVRFNQGKIAG